MPESEKPVMPIEEVERVVRLLQDANYVFWLDGGWGVDALLERQTRQHKDLDICIKLVEISIIRKLLESSGYKVTEDETPTRLIMYDALNHRIDLHLLKLDQEGNGRQNYKGGFNLHPAKDLRSKGLIGKIKVNCLSPELQVKFRETYSPDEKSKHDVRELAHKFQLVVPAGF